MRLEMRGMEFLPSHGRPPCGFPSFEPMPLRFRPRPGQLAPAPRVSARRSTSDKTGQGTRARWKRLLVKRYGAICHIHLAAGITDQRAVIDLELKWPDPGCFTRDHVRPRSQGGRDTIRNQRPAHKLCNESRGAKPLPGL